MTTNHEPGPADGRPAPPVRPVRRSRGWVWFFVILAVLTIAATAFLWIYNVGQQLTPERLAAARKLWDQKRPADYDLTWTKEGSASGTFMVFVRQGAVRAVLMKEEAVEGGKARTVDVWLPRRLYDRYDVAGLFADLQGFLRIIKEQDKDRKRILLRARFDPEDGHLIGYVYSNPLLNPPQRVKVTVEVRRVAPGTAVPRADTAGGRTP